MFIIFHPFAQKRSPPWTDLHQICTDIIAGNKFFGDRSRGVDSVGVENCPLPLTKPIAVNTGLALYPAARDNIHRRRSMSIGLLKYYLRKCLFQ